MKITPGLQIKHYKILSRLGAGGMGEVFVAEDTTLRRKVAIKFLRADSAPDERFKSRLIREARAAATLDHPNICAIYEVGEENGRDFIVLQYVEGETLAALLKRGPLSITSALAIAAQVADALAEAHKRGIIHRDIKPENVMITGDNRAKVLDFGLAKISLEGQVASSEIETATQLSSAGVVMGTVPYMSPEQLRGEDLNPRSDIFSFGVMLYEMLSGKRPFDAASKAEIISAILTQEPRPLPGSLLEQSQHLEPFLRKCMAKDARNRYEDMQVLIADLEQFALEVNQSPTTSKRTPLAATTQITQKKSNRVVYLLVAACAIAGFAYWMTWQDKSPAIAIRTSQKSPAYDDYLHGKEKVSSQNRSDNEAAIQLLQKAIASDPDYAPAYAALARAYTVKAFYFASPAEQKQLSENAAVAVEKALVLDPNLAEAHLARGVVLWTKAKRFPHEMAIRCFERAIALNPNLAEAHHQLSLVYNHIGLIEKGKMAAEKALDLEPNNTMARFRLGTSYYYMGRFEEALRIFKSTPEEANPSLQRRTLASTLFELGRYEEASEATNDFLKNYSDEGGAMTALKAMLLAREGKIAEAEAQIQQSINIGKDFGHFHHTTFIFACTYSLMNKPGEAVKWLQYTADNGFPSYPFVEKEAGLKNIRNDPEFIKFLSELSKQYDYYKSTL